MVIEGIKIPGDIIFKVQAKPHGIEYVMIDTRHSTPLDVRFLLEPHEEEEYMNCEGLYRIECTLGLALANMVLHNARVN